MRACRFTRTLLGPLTGLMMLLVADSVLARDYPQALPAVDPLFGVEQGDALLLPRGYAEIAYNYHTFLWSNEDVFDLSALGSFTVLQLGGLFAVGLFYGSYLLVGPLATGDTAATVAPWWMNAVQFEYGLFLAVDIFGFHLLLGYGRTSQHPLRPAYSEVTTDTVLAGVAAPPIRFSQMELALWMRAGLIDLFDFWQSTVSKPRAVGVAAGAGSWQVSIWPWLRLFAGIDLSLIVLRAGGLDLDIWAETGVILGEETTRLKLYLEYFHSGDTEELRGRITPADLLGLGFRLYLNP